MGFTEGYAVINGLAPSITSFPTGWDLLSGTQCPRDIVDHPTENALYEPATAVVAPLFAAPSSRSGNSSSWCRGYTGTRVTTLGAGFQVARFRLFYTGAASVGIHLMVNVDPALSYVFCTVGSSVSPNIMVPLLVNAWYLLGVEVLGNIARFYMNTTPSSLALLPGPSTLTHFYTMPHPLVLGSTGAQMNFNLSPGATGLADYSGVSGMVLEELQPPIMGFGGNTPPTSTDAMQAALPSFHWSGGTGPLPYTPDMPSYVSDLKEESAYHRYKTLRSAMDTLNHLRLDP